METGESMRGGGGMMYKNATTPLPPTHRRSDYNRRIIGSSENGRNLRVYQAWKGSNVILSLFLCFPFHYFFFLSFLRCRFLFLFLASFLVCNFLLLQPNKPFYDLKPHE